MDRCNLGDKRIFEVGEMKIPFRVTKPAELPIHITSDMAAITSNMI